METLPKDVIVKIALELSPSDLIKFCLTEKKYRDYICNNRDFWIKKLEIDYPYALYLPIIQGIKLANPKNTYIRNFNEIQNKIENFIKDQKAKANLEFGIDIPHLEKEMNKFILEKINDSFQNSYDEIDKFYKYFISYNHTHDLATFFLTLFNSQRAKMEKIKELKELIKK